jgi:hypothetical protein
VATVLVATALVLAACGGASGSPSNAAFAGQRSRRGFVAQTPKVRACLQKQGVTLPRGGGRFRGNGGPPPAGTSTLPRTGTNAQPPSGAGGPPPGAGGPPPGAGGPRRGGARRDPAQFAKLRAALKKCGVTPPARGPGAPRPATPTSTTPSTTAS